MVEPDPSTSTNPNGTVASGGLLTTYSYNTLGNLTGVNQGGQARSFKYDSLGRLTNQHLAEREKTLDAQGNIGSEWSDFFKYDNRGNLIERMDARRVKTTFSYNSDPLNRLHSVSYDKSNALDAGNIKDAATVTYGYETATGQDKTRLLSVSLTAVNGLPANFGNQSFGYDSEGRLSSVTQQYGNSRSAATSYKFDTLDRVEWMDYPAAAGGAIRRAIPTYDLASRLQSLTYNGTAMATNPVYNASSQTTQLNIGSAVQEQYTFDPQTGLLTNQKVVQGATTHMDLTYDYLRPSTSSGRTGQLTKIVDNLRPDGKKNRHYTYDNLGRLQKARGGVTGTQWSQTYSYDRWGNRLTVAAGGTDANNNPIPSDGLASVTYDTATNRITSANFSYDAAGNQKQSNESGLVNDYKYDAAGRLVEVSNSAGLHTYAYGASNQRLQSVEGSATTLYTWAGGSVIAEYDGAMNWTKSSVYLGGRLLATDTTAGVQYQHPDRLGTRLVTNVSGGMVSENVGLPFGAIIAGESVNLGGSGTKKRFTSYERSDNTLLDYAVNRQYSAAQGRFTQVDPIEMDAVDLSDPQTLNLYAYCGNDPINQIDPDGLFSFKKLFGAISKALKWIAIAAIVAVAILTFVAPAALASFSIWAANHATLAALLGINTPHFAIINLAATAGGAAVSLGFGATIAASVGAVGALANSRGARRPPPRPRQLRVPARERRGLPRNWGVLPFEYHHFVPWENYGFNHHLHPLIKQAGWSQNDLRDHPANGGMIVNHHGRHGRFYNEEVRRRLDQAYDRVKQGGHRDAAQKAAIGVMRSIERDIANGTLRLYHSKEVFMGPQR